MIYEQDFVFGLTKTIMTTAFTILLMFSLSDFKYSIKHNLAVYSGYMIYVILSSWLLINKIGWIGFLRICLLSISAPAVAVTYLSATDHAMQAVFNYATQIDIALVLSVTATLANTAFHGGKAADLFIRALLFLSVFILEYRLLRKPFRKAAGNPENNWVLLGAVPVSFCVLIVLCGLYPVHFTCSRWSVIHVFAAAAAMAVIYGVIFRSLAYSSALSMALREKDILAAQVSALKAHSDTIALNMKQDAVLRNNIQTYSRTIYAMLKNGKTDQALEILGQANQEFSHSLPSHYCANKVLNDIFSFYLDQARADGISVRSHLDVPESLPVSELELAVVFANAIENARSALALIPREEERLLELRLVSRPRFIFEIANTFCHPVNLDEDGIPVNADGLHGIRTLSIIAFAKKNSGILDYDISDGMFRLRILIQQE